MCSSPGAAILGYLGPVLFGECVFFPLNLFYNVARYTVECPFSPYYALDLHLQPSVFLVCLRLVTLLVMIDGLVLDASIVVLTILVVVHFIRCQYCSLLVCS